MRDNKKEEEYQLVKILQDKSVVNVKQTVQWIAAWSWSESVETQAWFSKQSRQHIKIHNIGKKI